MRIFFSTILLVIISSNLNAQDSISNPVDSAAILWMHKIDSLLESHYLTKPIENREYADSVITDIPDSVFRERLAEMHSAVPLSYNSRVQAYLNVYVKKSPHRASRFLALSDYYFPLFEQVLAEHDLPYELKYLPVIESALNPNAVSRAGATGLWQIMYRTGKHLGLEINSYVDERRDPLMSSHAACRYLSDLYSVYEDWILVIAAYNCGPGVVNRAIRRSGGKKNYWDLYYYLPRETRNYVPAFIAVSYMFEYAEAHGFRPDTLKLPVVTDTVMIREKLHFDQITAFTNIKTDALEFLNPQYRKKMIPAGKKEYPLRLPFGEISDFLAMEDSVYHYKDSLFFRKARFEAAPATRSRTYYSKAPQPPGTEALSYRVKQGDVLGWIAMWYDVGLSRLKAWNGLYSNRIKQGQELVVYVPKGQKKKYAQINTMSYEQKMRREGLDPDSGEKEVKIDPDYEYYTVRYGDNPWTIAKKFPGISAENILDLNNIDDAGSLKIGQKIKIKKKS